MMTNAARFACAGLGAALFLLLVQAPAQAAEPVKIGVIYPLTGNAASAGASAKDAVELGAEIVNGDHPELTFIPLAAGAGLALLGAAYVTVVFISLRILGFWKSGDLDLIDELAPKLLSAQLSQYRTARP